MPVYYTTLENSLAVDTAYKLGFRREIDYAPLLDAFARIARAEREKMVRELREPRPELVEGLDAVDLDIECTSREGAPHESPIRRAEVTEVLRQAADILDRAVS